MTAFYLCAGFEFYFFAGCQRLYRLLRKEFFVWIMLYHRFRKQFGNKRQVTIKLRKQPKIYCLNKCLATLLNITIIIIILIAIIM